MNNEIPISFTPFIYNNHLSPEGLLPREKLIEASAAWHCATLVIPILHRIPEQATLEGDVDQTANLRQVADSVAKIYGISVEDMMAFMNFVKAEAIRCGLPWPQRMDAWLATGGQSYNIVTREEGRLNIQ